MQLIRKGDKVQIIRGAERPQTADERKEASGEVIEVNPVDETCKVAGRNLVWKHKKGDGAENPGGRVQVEASIPLSNVLLFDEEESRADRVRVTVVDGKRVRAFRKSGRVIG